MGCHLNLFFMSEKKPLKEPRQPSEDAGIRCRPIQPLLYSCSLIFFRHSRTKYTIDSSTDSPVLVLVSKYLIPILSDIYLAAYTVTIL